MYKEEICTNSKIKNNKFIDIFSIINVLLSWVFLILIFIFSLEMFEIEYSIFLVAIIDLLITFSLSSAIINKKSYILLFKLVIIIFQVCCYLSLIFNIIIMVIWYKDESMVNYFYILCFLLILWVIDFLILLCYFIKSLVKSKEIEFENNLKNYKNISQNMLTK